MEDSTDFNPTPEFDPIKESSERIRRRVEYLSNTIGSRSVSERGKILDAQNYIISQLKEEGFRPDIQTFKLHDGIKCSNIELVITGKSEKSMVFFAHYDTVKGSAGADDNASGVAALIELASRLEKKQPDFAIRLVLTAPEEPPYFGTKDMGSYHYLGKLKRDIGKDNIVAVVSIESVGFYSQEKNSQHWPVSQVLLNKLYQDTGNFLMFVAGTKLDFFDKAADAFGKSSGLKTFTTNKLFQFWPELILGNPYVKIPELLYSDHLWATLEDIPAFMITDTAPFRNPHYHKDTDRPDTLDYNKIARLVVGLDSIITEVAKERR